MLIGWWAATHLRRRQPSRKSIQEECMHEDELSPLIRRYHLQVRLLLAGGGMPPARLDDEVLAVFRRYVRTCDHRPAQVSADKWLRGIVRRRLQAHGQRGDRLTALLASENASTLERLDATTLRTRLTAGLAALSRRKAAVIQAYYRDCDPIAAAAHLAGDRAATRNLLLRLRSHLRDLCTGKAALKTPAGDHS
jgi:hypothetical protein